MQTGKIISVTESALKCSFSDALKLNDCNGLFGNVVVSMQQEVPKLFGTLINGTDCNFFKRVMFTKTAYSDAPVIVGYRINRSYKNHKLAEMNMDGSFMINEGFSKLLVNTPVSKIHTSPIEVKSKILDPARFINLDITKKDFDKTLEHYNISSTKILTEYGNSMSGNRTSVVNLRSLRDNGVDIISLYNIGDCYLLIATSVKAKITRRKLLYNDGFIDFINDMKDTQLDHVVAEISDSLIIESYPVGTLEDIKDVVTNSRWADTNPGAKHMNQILDKILSSGVKSLSGSEQKYLDNL